MKLNKLLGAVLSIAIAFPAQVHAQETVKTSPGYAKTKTFVHHHDARKVSKHLTPIRGGKSANPLMRPGVRTPHYMLPNIPQQRHLYQTPAGTTICGSLIYCRSWEQLPDFLPRPYGIYSFTAADGAVTSQDIAIDNNLYANGGAYIKDGIYSFVNHYTYDDEQYITFYQYDMDTWEMVTEEEGDEDFVAVTLTYNAVEDAVYGIFWSDDEDGYIFDQIDIEEMGGYRYNTGSALDTKIMALASNDDGDVYGIGLDGVLYLMDVDTGDAEEVGELGVTPANYLQSAAFDSKTGLLYWAAQLEDGTSALYEVDTETGEATLVAEFEDGEEIVGMWVKAPEAEDEAPAAVEGLAVQFSDGQTTGLVTFTAPTETYAGEQLEGGLTYTIYANSEEVASGTAEPGENVSQEVSLQNGENDISVVVANEAGSSPASHLTAWIGADAPVAPSNIILTIDQETLQATLTWDAPATGQHEGYVDPSLLTYNVVRYPDAVAVAEGLHATTFTEVLPETDMTVYYYEVTAVNGSQKGKSGRSNSVTAGGALTPPYHEDFAQRSGFDLYTVLDSNKDNNTWEFAYGRVRYYGEEQAADDWLITPNVRLQNDRTYKVGFKFNASDDSKMERIGVNFGQGDDPTKMDVLLAPEEFNNTDDIDYEEEITVEEPGNYRMAIHALSDADQGYITVDDIYIIEGTKFTAPAAATDIVVTPAPLGALQATIAFVAPTQTFRGETLGSIDRIEVWRGETLIKEFGATAPGAALTLTDEGMPNGVNRYRIIAYNSEGAGEEAVKAAWIGIDEPLEPLDIRLADNGNDVTVSWQAPGEEGIHGGYVIPSDLKYNVYDRNGNSLVRNISTMDYTDRSAQLTGKQYVLYYYVSATSAGGEGYADVSARMVAGTPYTLPFTASFANGGLEDKLWWLEGDSRGSWVVTYLNAQDGDGGCAFFAADEAGDSGYLNSGRIALDGAANPGLVFYYYAQPGKKVRLDVFGCQTTDDDQLLRAIDYGTLEGEEGWRREYIDLSPMKDARYVVLKFRATADDPTVNVCIDNIQVRDILAHDLMATLEAPALLRLGTENTVSMNVQNMGSMLASSYSVVLTANGEEIATAEGTQLGVGESQHFDFAYTPSVTIDGDIQLQAKVVYADDQNLDNNMTDVVSVRTQKPDYPTATNLIAEASGNQVTLSWDAPAMGDEVVTDDFESYEPWIMDGIGNWKVYDGDKAGTLQYSDIWVPNAGKEMAFEVFNTTDEEFETATRRKFLIAHSGVQYLMAFDPSPSYADQSDDWLISPLLSGEAQTISFFAKSCASNYPETFEVMYSTTDDDPESFVNIETFPDVKGGLEWTEYNISLPEGTKYFAIHVITVDGLAFQLDDITYRPATLVVNGYKVYRDGQCVATTAKDQTTYTDTVAEDGTHVYQVSVCYTIGESQLSNEAAVLTAIQFVDGSQTLIRSEHGQIVIDHAEGKAITVYTPDGKEVYAGQGRRHLSIPTAAGQYVVTVGGQPVNLIVR